MDLDKIIAISFPLLLLVSFFLVKNYNLLFLKKTTDNQFYKPQAFHSKSIPRIGGLLIFIFLNVFLITFYNKNLFFYQIIFLGLFFFLLGFMADLNIKIKPEFRLFLMLIVSFFLIYFLNIRILNTQLSILNNLINSHKIISSIFVCLCLVFIINGCNLIDGFNGLLIIHSTIILGILYFINFQNLNIDYIKYLILFSIIVCFSVLFFNFPKAKIFLGDGGAYFLGIIISLIVIELSNLNKIISPFFFASLLFYIFFEVFFSFFRKIFFLRSSPLMPDKKHLHMLFFNFLKIRVNDSFKANFLTSLILNIIYLIAIIPSLFYYNDEFFCKTYFFVLIFFYFIFYFYLEKK